MKKIWINFAKSFEDAEDFDLKYYLSMTKKERVGTVQFLRETYWKMKQGKKYGNHSRRLRKTIKFIQQT